MGADSLYRFPARMESLVSMVEHLQSVATVPDTATVLRAETALEELLSNSIVHGGGLLLPQAWVWMSATARVDGVLLRYEDPFAPFDPMAKIDEALRRTASPMEQQPVGGLGLLMVFRMADEFRYLRDGERNRIDLLFASRPSR
jgi:anti-sigma regulatory factor (Ser/Thr protein kinase)